MQKIIAKIVLLGSVGVGKTSLTRQFVQNKFSEEYQSTIGVKVDKKVITFSDGQVDLLIWDLAGEIYQSELFRKYLQGASGVIGIYDITRPSTHTKLQEVFEELDASKMNMHKIILANKSDLSGDENYNTQINESHTYNYLTSAKTGENVNEAFTHLARTILSSI
jgi:small GTP-binding protein